MGGGVVPIADGHAPERGERTARKTAQVPGRTSAERQCHGLTPTTVRVNPEGLPNEAQGMMKLRTTLWGCFLLALPGSLHAAAAAGYVIQWGWNTAGPRPSPPKVVASSATAVVAGDSHYLLLRPDGTVFGWGGNSHGEATGVANTNATYVPTAQSVRIKGAVLSNVVSIAAGRQHSLALTADGNVVTWGRNFVPREITAIKGIAADYYGSWVLTRKGSVIGWNSEPSSDGNGKLFPVEHLSNVVSVAAGMCGFGTRGVALLRDGTVGHWGGESIHKDATPPVGLSNVVAVAAGMNHSLALTRAGTVWGWGFNTFGQATGMPTTGDADPAKGPVIIGGHVLNNIASIAAGREYSMALTRQGTAVVWGHMATGADSLAPPSGLSNVVAIAAGPGLSCLAITTNPAVAARFMSPR